MSFQSFYWSQVKHVLIYIEGVLEKNWLCPGEMWTVHTQHRWLFCIGIGIQLHLQTCPIFERRKTSSESKMCFGQVSLNDRLLQFLNHLIVSTDNADDLHKFYSTRASLYFQMRNWKKVRQRRWKYFVTRTVRQGDRLRDNQCWVLSNRKSKMFASVSSTRKSLRKIIDSNSTELIRPMLPLNSVRERRRSSTSAWGRRRRGEVFCQEDQ